jgi:rfaE bifunctional protein kinase chain/domain/rfaE bifunctional protein nucleotidyltransferase chain/domain
MMKKILPLEDLVKKVEKLRKAGKVVVQSNGVFDLIHPGLVTHLQSAKQQGDVLVVTVIKDKDVRRGPGRPIFNEKLRAENVASLSFVDYIGIVGNETPFESVRRIRPNVFAKGQAYKERDQVVHKKLFEEERDFIFDNVRLYETPGLSFSSTRIINDVFEMYPEETREFLGKFAKKFSFNKIAEKINSLRDMKILLVGDGIIDEYHYCLTMNKSAKSPIIVNKYLSHDVFAGGAFAIANHLAGICSEVHLVSLLGAEDSREDFILDSLKSNVKPKLFFREDGPTIVKKRYISHYLNQKLFEVNYLNDEYIPRRFESEIIKYLRSVIPEYDLVLVSDFGHGFITKRIIKAVEGSSRVLAINTQSNGANAGYNLITKYGSSHFICIDEAEIRLAAQDKFGNIEAVMEKIAKSTNSDYIIVTQGKKGSVCIDRNGSVNRTPVFSSKVVDTVGAGDAFFAFTAPCFARGMGMDLVSFIGNAVGALAVQIVGNKRSVEKSELLEFIHALLG